jgi:hypothetical protein
MDLTPKTRRHPDLDDKDKGENTRAEEVMERGHCHGNGCHRLPPG